MLDGSTRLFVTGGTGFVGRSLLRWLAEPAHGLTALRPVILSRAPQAFARAWPELAARAELVEGDVRSGPFPSGRFDLVLHGATDTSMAAHARADEHRDVMVEGTRRVLDFAASSGASRVVFLSSGAVYGPQPSELTQLDEDYPGSPAPDDPAGAYGRAKRDAERLCVEWSQGGRAASIARLFAFIGEDLPLDQHFAIGNFLRDALARRTIEVKGDGSPVRTYLHGADLSAWLVALLAKGAGGRAYNVGSDEQIDIAGLARLVAKVVSPGLEVQVAKSRADYAGRHRYVPSIARIQREVGVRITLPLEAAIRRTAEWHRRQAGPA